MKRKALGRGLSALIPAAADRGGEVADDFFICPIERIRPAEAQPRRSFDEQRIAELAASLREHGLVQPLAVRPAEKDGEYVLIAGERRWRAAQKAGIHEVPVVIRDVSDAAAFELALVENIQREDLNPIEEAEAYRRLIGEHGYKQDKLAARVGKDRSTIANSLRLLQLPETAQRALIEGTISAGHARALLGLDKAADISRALRDVVRHQHSVRQTEQLVRSVREKQSTPPAAKDTQASANLLDLQERLMHTLKTRVRLHHRAPSNSGKVEIHYSSLDELDRLLEVLLK